MQDSHERVCQAEGCTADMCLEKPYNRRKHLCSQHLRALVVTQRGCSEPCRFCFQCGRLQPLHAFDGTQRSCRVRLEMRRKRPASSESSGEPRAAAPAKRSKLAASSSASSLQLAQLHDQTLAQLQAELEQVQRSALEISSGTGDSASSLEHSEAARASVCGDAAPGLLRTSTSVSAGAATAALADAHGHIDVVCGASGPCSASLGACGPAPSRTCSDASDSCGSLEHGALVELLVSEMAADQAASAAASQLEAMLEHELRAAALEAAPPKDAATRRTALQLHTVIEGLTRTISSGASLPAPVPAPPAPKAEFCVRLQALQTQFAQLHGMLADLRGQLASYP